MEGHDPELMLHLALHNIERIKNCLDSMESEIQGGLKGLQDRKPKRKRSKKDES